MRPPTPNLVKSLITAAAILFVGGLIGSCFLPQQEEDQLSEGFPTREVVDTRPFDHLVASDSLKLVIVDAFFKALPNEMGLCIYGYFYGDTIVVTALRADSTISAEGFVHIFCTEKEGDDPILGDAHSHPGATNPAYPCFPSQQDYFSLLLDNHAIMVIYCGNGSGVTVFRDGRWWNFAWR